MSEAELKPCPFCGSKVIIGDDCFSFILITCTVCNINTKYYSHLPISEIKKHWNTRVEVKDA